MELLLRVTRGGHVVENTDCESHVVMKSLILEVKERGIVSKSHVFQKSLSGGLKLQSHVDVRCKCSAFSKRKRSLNQPTTRSDATAQTEIEKRKHAKENCPIKSFSNSFCIKLMLSCLSYVSCKTFEFLHYNYYET